MSVLKECENALLQIKDIIFKNENTRQQFLTDTQKYNIAMSAWQSKFNNDRTIFLNKTSRPDGNHMWIQNEGRWVNCANIHKENSRCCYDRSVITRDAALCAKLGFGGVCNFSQPCNWISAFGSDTDNVSISENIDQNSLNIALQNWENNYRVSNPPPKPPCNPSGQITSNCNIIGSYVSVPSFNCQVCQQVFNADNVNAGGNVAFNNINQVLQCFNNENKKIEQQNEINEINKQNEINRQKIIKNNKIIVFLLILIVLFIVIILSFYFIFK